MVTAGCHFVQPIFDLSWNFVPEMNLVAPHEDRIVIRCRTVLYRHKI
jgi:hypothetical protein